MKEIIGNYLQVRILKRLFRKYYVKLSMLNGVLQTGTQLRVEKHDCFTCKCSRKQIKKYEQNHRSNFLHSYSK